MKKLLFIFILISMTLSLFAQREDQLNMKGSSADDDTLRVVKDGESAIMLKSTFQANLNNLISVNAGDIATLEDTAFWHNLRLTSLENDTTYNPVNWGAISNDGLSDSAAFNDCLAAAVADSVTMYIPFGKYKVNNLDIAVAGGIIKIIADEGTIIDGTGSLESYLINLKGTRTDDDVLTASPSAGDTSITSTLAADLAIGDIVLIESTVEWNPSASSIEVKSEMCEVSGLDGNDIWLKAPLFGSYDSDSVTVYKMNMPDVTVKGITLLGSGNRTGIRVYAGRNIDISNNKVNGTQTAGMTFQYIYGGKIENNVTTDTKQSGFGYGMLLGSLQHVNVVGNFLTEARHALSIGGTGISRMVNITGNHCGIDNSQSFWGIDFHSSAEFVTVTENMLVGGGIYSECDNIKVHNNTIYARDGKGIVFWLYGARGSKAMKNIKISDNDIWNLNTGQQAIQIGFKDDTVTVEEVKIVDNEIISPNTAGIYFADEGNTEIVIDVVKISDNIVNVDGGGAAVQITENGILIKNLFIIDNEFVGDNSSLIHFASADSATVVDAKQEIKIENNYIESTGSGEYVVSILAGNNLSFKNNIITGVTGDRAYSMRLFNVGHLDFIENKITSFSNRGGLNLDNGAGGGPETAYLKDNTFTNTSGSIDNGNSTVTLVSINTATQTTVFDQNIEVSGTITAPGLSEVQTPKQLYYNEGSGLVTFGDTSAAGGVYTAGNGLTLTANDFDLGGNLDTDTDLEMETGVHFRVWTGAGYPSQQLFVTDGAGAAWLEAYNDVDNGSAIVLSSAGAAGYLKGKISGNESRTYLGAYGLYYDADYSANSTARSLLDSAHIASMKNYPAINAQTGTTYTFVLSDGDDYVTLTNAAAITVTVPPNSSVAYPIGTTIDCEQSGAGTVTFAEGSGVTINSLGSDKVSAGQYGVFTLIKKATDTWTLTGTL